MWRSFSFVRIINLPLTLAAVVFKLKGLDKLDCSTLMHPWLN